MSDVCVAGLLRFCITELGNRVGAQASAISRYRTHTNFLDSMWSSTTVLIVAILFFPRSSGLFLIKSYWRLAQTHRWMEAVEWTRLARRWSFNRWDTRCEWHCTVICVVRERTSDIDLLSKSKYSNEHSSGSRSLSAAKIVTTCVVERRKAPSSDEQQWRM